VYLSEKQNVIRFIDVFNLEDAPPLTMYITMLYWMLTVVSTVGFGDYYPVTLWQRLYMAAIMIFSALFFGYLVNAVGKFMLENQTEEISIKIKLAGINSELKEK
jgi:hypothetical protein